jgi:hypothetical protein
MENCTKTQKIMRRSPEGFAPVMARVNFYRESPYSL